MVGVERFELPTLWSQTRCATRLRYTPYLGWLGEYTVHPAPATHKSAAGRRFPPTSCCHFAFFVVVALTILSPGLIPSLATMPALSSTTYFTSPIESMMSRE